MRFKTCLGGRRSPLNNGHGSFDAEVDENLKRQGIMPMRSNTVNDGGQDRAESGRKSGKIRTKMLEG